MVKPTTPGLSDIASRTRWSVVLHWYMLFALSFSGLFSIYIAEGISSRFAQNMLLLSCIICSNFIFYFLARAKRGDAYYRTITLAIILYELAIITLAFYVNGGLESQIFILYVVPILMSAIVLQGKWVYTTAFISIFTMSLYLWADYKGWITSLNKLTFITRDYKYVLNTIVFIGLMILLITYLASHIINLLQQKEHQAVANAEALARAQSIARLGSWEWDILQDTMTWSEQLYKMFGIRPGGSLSYAMFLEKIHPDDRNIIVKALDRSLKTGQPFRHTHRVVAGNKTRTIHAEGRVIKNAAGTPVKFIGTAQDITAEQELDQAKSEFVSIASHQLRTPATEVKMLLGILMQGYAGEMTPRHRDFVEKAYQSNERQIKIANDLLGVARLDTGRIKLNKKPLELGRFLSTIAENFTPLLIAKDQHLVFKPQKKAVTVKADAERLQLAIENLIDNASKYTRKRGTVTLSYSTSNSHAIITIQDTGVGISKSDQKHLFGIYSRLDNPMTAQVDGSGLGLYLVKKLVDLHHGKVTITSKPKAGTTFRIHLPL